MHAYIFVFASVFQDHTVIRFLSTVSGGLSFVMSDQDYEVTRCGMPDTEVD